ncbi:cryptochrome-1-like [Babylonia areolata]|uniref:cryptochrome-1-like n=1 Tax=Babylonia areolata TaxID=304850 RepID=UPI003FCF8B6A
MTQRTIHWFRKGLRLHDNPALLAACENASHLYPVFFLDPHFVKGDNYRVGVNRWRFLLECLRDLDCGLRKLNSRLYVVKGRPQDMLPLLFREWCVTRLTFEVDTEPFARHRDREVEGVAAAHGVEVVTRVSHTLFDVEKTIAKNGGSPPLTYQGFQKLLSKLGLPARPVDTLCKAHLQDCETPVADDHEDRYGVPSLADLGKEETECGPRLYPGGETEAVERMERHLKKTNWICKFEKPQTSPNSLEPSTTVLSPYLKFGCLSARTFYYRLLDVYRLNKVHTQPPVSLHGQLLWREFFYTAALGTSNFDRMKDNPVCVQVQWDSNPQYLAAWKQGRTGYPFIDAIMTQLRQEGWIHHLARHSVACFLTRGDLWLSWEEGQKVFEEYLLDADWSINAGNWMWLSASAFFHQYFRVYSPVAFGKKTDKNGDYIK